MTNPQEELLKNRMGTMPPPQGHKHSYLSSACLSSSQGLVPRMDSLWSQTYSQGGKRLLPCNDLALSLRLPQPLGWGRVNLILASIIFLNSLIMLLLGLKSLSISSAAIASSLQPLAWPSGLFMASPLHTSYLLLLFIFYSLKVALLNHLCHFKITTPSLLSLSLSFVMLLVSSRDLPLHPGALPRAHLF